MPRRSKSAPNVTRSATRRSVLARSVSPVRVTSLRRWANAHLPPNWREATTAWVGSSSKAPLDLLGTCRILERISKWLGVSSEDPILLFGRGGLRLFGGEPPQALPALLGYPLHRSDELVGHLLGRSQRDRLAQGGPGLRAQGQVLPLLLELRAMAREGGLGDALRIPVPDPAQGDEGDDDPQRDAQRSPSLRARGLGRYGGRGIGHRGRSNGPIEGGGASSHRPSHATSMRWLAPAAACFPEPSCPTSRPPCAARDPRRTDRNDDPSRSPSDRPSAGLRSSSALPSHRPVRAGSCPGRRSWFVAHPGARGRCRTGSRHLATRCPRSLRPSRPRWVPPVRRGRPPRATHDRAPSRRPRRGRVRPHAR